MGRKSRTKREKQLAKAEAAAQGPLASNSQDSSGSQLPAKETDVAQLGTLAADEDGSRKDDGETSEVPSETPKTKGIMFDGSFLKGESFIPKPATPKKTYCKVCKVEAHMQCNDCVAIAINGRYRGPLTESPYYCSRKHQVKDWKEGHKDICGSRRHQSRLKAMKEPARHVDLLYVAVMKDVMLPRIKTTTKISGVPIICNNFHIRHDFGFENCQTMEEEHKLFAVYKHLLDRLQCDLEDLELACKNGRLYYLMLYEFGNAPDEHRGGHLNWIIWNERKFVNKFTKIMPIEGHPSCFRSYH